MKIVQICRVTNSEDWATISNPQEDYAFKASRIILSNTFNEYMAYVNAGVEYRYIRESDLSKYQTENN